MGRTVPHAPEYADVRKGSRESPPASLLLAHCSIQERRVVLEALCDHPECSLSELASRVVARRQGIDPGAVPADARDDATVSLYHNHLQQLTDACLIALDETGDTVTATLVPGLSAEHVRHLITAGDGHWETLGVLLGDPRRERAVSLLAAADDEALPLEDLARAIAALERAETESLPEAAVESTRVSLHHVHLPKLENGGLVDYDAERGTVTLKAVPDAYEFVVDPTVEHLSA